MLVHPGPAEIDQQTVPHQLGDVAIEPLDLGGDRAPVGAQDLAHLFGIEPDRQLGRADQIDEHDREMTAIARACQARFGPARIEGSDRLQQPPAMAKGADPEILQIAVRQGSQQRRIDVIGCEQLGIPLEPQPCEPSGDVHHRCSHPLRKSVGG